MKFNNKCDDKYIVSYNEKLDPQYWDFPRTVTFETSDKGLAEFCSTIHKHTRELFHSVRAVTATQRGRVATLPRCGADGVQLTQTPGMTSVLCFGERDPGVILSALLQHLKLEAYIDESKAGHPVLFRKAKP